MSLTRIGAYLSGVAKKLTITAKAEAVDRNITEGFISLTTETGIGVVSNFTSVGLGLQSNLSSTTGFTSNITTSLGVISTIDEDGKGVGSLL
jgi:nucleoside recognition membrane protein YjiH